ncbi:MAG: DUF1015 domain-containing protein [Oscillospiraceae bacterium]|nr:DUF1015 domain-containing protein [Oscillospiraceae bacterium]
MSRWAVVACDQFTSQPEYWEDAARLAGDISALKLILPEAYLESPDSEKMIADIRTAMTDYLHRGIFKEYKDSMIYIERTDSTGKVRQGLVGMIDLEQYDFRKGSTSPVRATEATVAERIPPRLKVRRGAPLELPHIMILIDDPERTVIERIGGKKASLEKLYDFTLMKNGGSIKGYLVGDEDIDSCDKALAALGSRESFEKRYGIKDVPVLLYAMGDGNHSLATAKEYYEELKRENPDKDMSCHPARYALAEIVNLHSEALEFEAIHRIITDIEPADLLGKMTEALELTGDISENMQSFEWVCCGETKRFGIKNPTSNLTVGSVQSFLDGYLKEKGGKIDYIHGANVVKELAMAPRSAGILLPDMGKEELFPTVIKDGALPRKTFSMGHAEDKRYYIEARKIK